MKASGFITLFKKFLREEHASPAIEAGLLFPMMITLFCGVMDTGVLYVVNMKVTNASQMISDLVSRDTTISTGEINDAIVAGRMALLPYPADSYGVDIAGIQFIGTSKTPTVQWRTTQNMSPNQEVTSRSAGLGAQNEGVIAVTTKYVYTPYFSDFLVGSITMGEESYVRGRKGLFVAKV